MQTVVGYYNTVAKATQVKAALETEGFNDVTVIDQNSNSYSTGYEGTNPEHNTVGGKIKHFFSSLTGDEDTSHEHYTRGVSAGGAVVAVNVSDERAEAAADLLERHGATNVEGDAGTGYDNSSATAGTGIGAGTGVYDAGDRNFGTGTGTLMGSTGGAGNLNTTGTTGSTDYAGTTGTTGYPNTTGTTGTADYTGASGRAANVTGEQVIPVVEEELVVGKRQVERGGVRIFSRVVSQPVTESVNLHDERVVVDRRAVDRPATEADFNPETRSVEVTAMGEEAVVGKASRVVEEIVVGKEATNHTEQVGETIRHTEVDVEPIGTETTTTGARTTDPTKF